MTTPDVQTLIVGAGFSGIGAGILLVREAGGRVTSVEGRDIQPAHTSVVATNGIMHDWLLAQIRGG